VMRDVRFLPRLSRRKYPRFEPLAQPARTNYAMMRLLVVFGVVTALAR
jgi:hypothetical protein